MQIVIQRVQQASVIVRDNEIGSIEKGLLILAGIDQNDTDDKVRRMVEKVLKFRIFGDQDGKMNRSIVDVTGELLLVPNFTLSADTESGNRPSFGGAAPPDRANDLFEKMTALFKENIKTVAGEFGAHMEVQLCNDGPVTFVLKN